jgi:hypothetical protein
MMAIYLSISLSPLTSTVLRSKTVAHALTGVCAGDCDICGCSPESRASKTCCCAKKKQQLAAEHLHDVLPDCCKKSPQQKGTVMLSCGCPCGSGKAQFAGPGKVGEIMPYYFTVKLAPAWREAFLTLFNPSFHSRLAEPPDPPPRQS